MIAETVFHEPSGIFLNRYPDEAAKAAATERLAFTARRADAIRDFIDTVPNLNSEYDEEIKLTREYLAHEKIHMPPLVVLERVDFDQVLKKGNVHAEASGIALAGRLVIAEDTEDVQTFGKDFILGKMLHEGAHPVAEMLSTTILGEYRAGHRRLHNLERVPGKLGKYALRQNGLFSLEGEFIEEAVAELTKVRGLQAMGREPKADGLILQYDDGSFYIGGGGSVSLTDRPGEISLPVEFMSAVSLSADKTSAEASTAPSGMAAYGLELLDQCVPGLYQQLKAARYDPAEYRQAIKAIDTVRPGLYQDLRRLEYTEKDFREGLRLIKTAVA